MRARQHQQRVAVGVAARDGLGRERAGKAGLGLDHDRLAEALLHLVAEDAGDDVDVAARREALQELDEAVRIVLLRQRRRRKPDQHRDRRDEPLDHANLPMPPPLLDLAATAADFALALRSLVNAPKRHDDGEDFG